jgi:hypothetical protein
VRKPNRPTQPQNQTRPEEEEEAGEQTKIIIMFQKSKNPEILPQTRKKNTHTHKRSTEFSASTTPYLRTISEPPPAIPRLRSLSLFSPTLLAQHHHRGGFFLHAESDSKRSETQSQTTRVVDTRLDETRRRPRSTMSERKGELRKRKGA